MPERALDSLAANVDAAIKLADRLEKLVVDVSQAISDRRMKKICEALRKIFFTPSGVLGLLSAIGEGHRVSFEEYEAAFGKFREADEQVRQAVQYLEDGTVLRDIAVPADDSELLMQITYGKLNLRRAIFRKLPDYESIIDPANRDLVKQLSSAIKNLNRVLVDTDNRLNPALRGR